MVIVLSYVNDTFMFLIGWLDGSCIFLQVLQILNIFIQHFTEPFAFFLCLIPLLFQISDLAIT